MDAESSVKWTDGPGKGPSLPDFDTSKVVVVVQTRGRIPVDLYSVICVWTSWGVGVHEHQDHLGGFLSMAREQAVTGALERYPKAEYVLMMDDDILPIPVDLIHLGWVLDANPQIDIAGGVCTSISRSTGNEFACFQSKAMKSLISQNGIPMVANGLPLPYRPLHVDRVGLGFTMIRRSVFEGKIAKPWFGYHPEMEVLARGIENLKEYPEDTMWVKDHPLNTLETMDKSLKSMADRMTRGTGVGEDYSLCDRVRLEGMKKEKGNVVVVPHVRPQHEKTHFSQWPDHLISPHGKVGIVIPVMGHPEAVRDCLESIASKTAVEHRVFVVDNGTPDNERREMAAVYQSIEYGDKLDVDIVCKQLGFAGAVNRGMRHAMEWGADLLCMVNSDVQVPFKWATRLMAGFPQHPGLGAVTPLSTYGAVASVKWAENIGYVGPRVHMHPLFPLFCTMVSRECWEDVGELDEQFFPAMFEDNDWCRRARLAGWQLGISSGTLVKHACGTTVAPHGYESESYIDQLKTTGPMYFNKHGIAGIDLSFVAYLDSVGVSVRPYLSRVEIDLLDRFIRGEPVSGDEVDMAMRGELPISKSVDAAS